MGATRIKKAKELTTEGILQPRPQRRFIGCYPPGVVIPSSAPVSNLRKFVFMKLPGEIRNRIYDLLFPQHRVLVRGYRVDEQPKCWGNPRPVCKPRYRLECGFEAGLRAATEFSCARSLVATEILPVCQAVYSEAIPVLYSRMGIRFESMKTLQHFLTRASPAGIASIRDIEIQHAQYGEPLMMEDRKWKKQHDTKWLKICTMIADHMTSLQILDLDFRICDWPTQLTLSAGWVQPLLTMKGAGLDRVKIVLHCNGITKERLSAFAEKLEVEMMHDGGKSQHKEEKEKQSLRELEKYLNSTRPTKPKPFRSLKITLAPGTTVQSANTPLPTLALKHFANHARLPPPVVVNW